MIKILNRAMLIIGALMFIVLLLFFGNEYNILPFEIISDGLHMVIIVAIPGLTTIFFIAVIVRLLFGIPPWIRWMTIVLIILVIAFPLAIWVFEDFHFSHSEMVIFFIFLGVALTFLSLYIWLKNKVVRIVLNVLVLLPMTFASISTCIILLEEIKPKYDFYHDEQISYEGTEAPNKNNVVVKQKKGSFGKSRFRLVHRNAGRIIRFSKAFEEPDLNGVWIVCNDEGIPVEKKRYYKGEILESLVYVPEYAAQVLCADSLENALSGNKELILVKGELQLYTGLNITDKKGLTITSAGKDEYSSIESKGQGWIVLNLVNCSDITIKRLQLNLKASGYSDMGIINLRNCKDIRIFDNKFLGQGRYLVYIDEMCENIQIKDNRFEQYDNFAVCSEKPVFSSSGNEFYKLGKEDNSSGILIKNLIISNENILQLADFSQSNQYASDYLGTARINGQDINTGFKGGLTDLYYDAGIRAGLTMLSTDKFRLPEECDYPYCENLLPLFSKGIAPFIRDPDKSTDTWGWQNDVDYREDKFLHVNVKFIEWIESAIQLSPDMVLPGKNISLGEIYTAAYQNTFRMFVETYMYMNFDNNFSLDSAVDNYKSASEREIYSFRGFLYHEFGAVLTDYNPDISEYSETDSEEAPDQEGESYEAVEGEDFEGYTGEGGGQEHAEYEGESEEQYYELPYGNGHYNYFVSDCVGFWIRRTIDGSAKSIYELLRINMEKFDREWMLEKYKEYGVE
jgi:hypothetical protein